MSNTVNIGGFIKFGQKEHMYDLLQRGIVYCNTLKYFRDHENKAIRDEYEGTSKITNTSEVKFFELTFPDNSHPPIQLHPKSLHLREFYDNPIANLYCLYTIHTDEVLAKGIYKIDPRMNEFQSTHLIIIHTPGIFIERMRAKLNEMNYVHKDGLVKYYDKKMFNGSLTMFDKPNEFAYQNEFRFLIGNDVQEPLKINLGSLEDIAIVIETKNLEHLEFRSPEFTHD